MTRSRLAILAVLLTPFAAPAQSDNPVSAAVRNHVAGRANNFLRAAEAMPADKYGFRPTPEFMTFSHLVAHVAQENASLCSKISGMPAPTMENLSDSDPKDKLVAALKTATDFCIEVLNKVDDSKLGENLTVGSRTETRAAAMVGLAAGLSEHLSQAAMDLRLNGLAPPPAAM